MKRFEVTLTECKTDGKTWSTRVLSETKDEAIEKAVPKLFGRSHSFHREHDECYSPVAIYGQVVKPAHKNLEAYNCVTPRVRVDVSGGAQ